MENKQCQHCDGDDLIVEMNEIEKKQNAVSPRCNTSSHRNELSILNKDLAIAIAALLLYIPSQYLPFVTINLIGETIPATLPNGVMILIDEGFIMLGILILFCGTVAPFLIYASFIGAHIGLHHQQFFLFRLSLSIIQHIKGWMMLDVFLISLGIACFQIQNYADIFVSPALYCLLLLQITTLILLTNFRISKYWQMWQMQYQPNIASLPVTSLTTQSIYCDHCHLTQKENIRCLRCDRKIYKRKPNSIQKTWCYLITAAIFIVPANMLPISIFLSNGKEHEDTILSGVISLIKSQTYGIALIIFVASILVPAAKILGLAYLLISIQLKRKIGQRYHMALFSFIKRIGKWSVMDLFVVSITLTLIDRGQLLDFVPGYGAVAFGLVVVFTMLAAESFDTRLIWDNYELSKTP